MARLLTKRWVVKLGTGILTDKRGRMDLTQVAQLVDQVAALKRQGYRITLVTSAAIACGMALMGLRRRPTVMKELQACAAIGQPPLMAIYDREFARHNLHVAQLLITYFDLDSRTLHENARRTLEHLLTLGTFVPIVNENDVVSYEEIKFGENDVLSAHVAHLVRASRLVILSTIEGMTRKPDGTGPVISHIPIIDRKIEALAGSSRNNRSVGGMISKLKAAKFATGHGIRVHIASGRSASVLEAIASGKTVGTVFDPQTAKKSA